MLFLRMDPVLTIGEVSRRSGVASSALRFYEERGLDFLGACGLRASPLSPIGLAPHCLYRLCSEGRIGTRGNRRGTCQASHGSYSGSQRLGAPFGRMDKTHRSKDRRASTSQSGANAMHRMRMPIHRQMQTCKSSRSSGASGTRPAVLAWLSPTAMCRGARDHLLLGNRT